MQWRNNTNLHKLRNSAYTDCCFILFFVYTCLHCCFVRDVSWLRRLLYPSSCSQRPTYLGTCCVSHKSGVARPGSWRIKVQLFSFSLLCLFTALWSFWYFYMKCMQIRAILTHSNLVWKYSFITLPDICFEYILVTCSHWREIFCFGIADNLLCPRLLCQGQTSLDRLWLLCVLVNYICNTYGTYDIMSYWNPESFTASLSWASSVQLCLFRRRHLVF